MIWQIGMWLALGALVLLGLRHWHFTSRQRALEAMLAELSAGRRPRAFAFFESPRFHRLGLLVESLADDQQAWRVQADAERSHLRAILASMAEGVLVCAPALADA